MKNKRLIYALKEQQVYFCNYVQLSLLAMTTITNFLYNSKVSSEAQIGVFQLPKNNKSSVK